MFMAEGTRSATGKLWKFKKGAFRFALDIDLPILPVTITGTKDILPKNTWICFPEEPV
ncbi:MAG: 1-acyl-sn-glycerol-3-phosphate acyltransferase [Deltaproteobacteria bacterium]|nr:1-acyl-sn-glycerol-3-phosphate acyltransferase [Deltaproteobacteria bacterium]